MDPIQNGGSIDPEKYSPPIKTKEEEKTDIQKTEDLDPVLDTKAQTQELSESKKTLSENRPGAPKRSEDSPEQKNQNTNKSGSLFGNLNSWTSGILSPGRKNALKDVAKGVLSDGLANAIISSKEDIVSLDKQLDKLREHLKPVIESDTGATTLQKAQSLATLPKLFASLPSETDADKENIRKTMQNIMSIEGVASNEREAVFLDITKSALDGSSLNEEEKTSVFQDLLKTGDPTISEGDLDIITKWSPLDKMNQ